MQTKQNNTIIYLSSSPDTSERWDIVAAALRTAGIRDIRPAPMPSLAFTPRHARQSLPLMLCSAEV
jgi:hypothetical protein